MSPMLIRADFTRFRLLTIHKPRSNFQSAGQADHIENSPRNRTHFARPGLHTCLQQDSVPTKPLLSLDFFSEKVPFGPSPAVGPPKRTEKNAGSPGRVRVCN